MSEATNTIPTLPEAEIDRRIKEIAGKMIDGTVSDKERTECKHLSKERLRLMDNVYVEIPARPLRRAG